MWADARAPAVLADAPPAVMRADAGASADAGAPAVLADAPDAVMLADAHARQSLQLLLWRLCRPPRGVLQWIEEQSGSGCGESGSFAGQSQHQRLQHRSSPGSFVTVFARLPHRLCPLSQFAHATRTLVRGGPTRPHRPRLVASHSTRPLFSLPPRAQLSYRSCSKKQHRARPWAFSGLPATPTVSSLFPPRCGCSSYGQGRSGGRCHRAPRLHR